MDAAVPLNLNRTITLPKSLSQVYRAVLIALEASYAQASESLRHEYGSRLFPSGKSSQQALHVLLTAPLPRLVRQGRNGVWLPVILRARQIELPDNGFLRMAGQSIRVVSPGAAVQESAYTDQYGRIWRVDVWAVPFNDTAVETLSLPTPDGYAGLMLQVPAATRDVVLHDLERLTPFVYMSIEGTLKRWQEYLAQASLLPSAFSHIKLTIAPGKLQYHSQRVALTVTDRLMKLSSDTLLSLAFSYFRDTDQHGDPVVRDVAGLTIKQSPFHRNLLMIWRATDPGPSLPQRMQVNWSEESTHRFPFDGMVMQRNGVSIAASCKVVPHPAVARPQLCYGMRVVEEGEQPQDVMSQELALLGQSLQVLESPLIR